MTQQLPPYAQKRMARKSSNRSKKPVPLIELTREDADRFWLLVDIRSDDECWLWLGGFQRKSEYGQFGWAYQGAKAHRVSFRLFYGADPWPCLILHRCDNRWCVNPHHMSLGNNADNSRDMVQKGRSMFGAKCAKAKMDDPMALLIMDDYRPYTRGHSIPALSVKYKRSRYSIWALLIGRTWKHLPRPASLLAAIAAGRVGYVKDK